MKTVDIAVVVVLMLSATADAAVVCVKNSPAGGALHARPVCKASETQLGSVQALQALLATSSAPGGGGALQLTGNIQIASPVSPTTSSPTRTIDAQAEPRTSIGESDHFCVGGGFPGQLGSQFACSSDADCNTICVAGDPGHLGQACSADSDCNSPNLTDGVCSGGATCQEFAILKIDGSDLIFTNFNVHVRSGSGATDGPPNGRGNLIIGYNESRGGIEPDDRTGSHNLVVGARLNFSKYGGVVAGDTNTIEGPFASVTGGAGNVASGPYASVTGGRANFASGELASVSGGEINEASGEFASVSGGRANTASGDWASLSGGQANTAGGEFASVSGGDSNMASGATASVSGGDYNTASGIAASVSGGELNTASGVYASVSGGIHNMASDGFGSSVSGGELNTASGHRASVSGGGLNTASGERASVSGGEQNTASGYASSVSGGDQNTASGQIASVSAGYSNIASADEAAVSGGVCNVAGLGTVSSCTIAVGATAQGAAVCGGRGNFVTGSFASVGGGLANSASGEDATVSGGEGNIASGKAASVSGGSLNGASTEGASVSGGVGVSDSGPLTWHAKQAPGYPALGEY